MVMMRRGVCMKTILMSLVLLLSTQTFAKSPCEGKPKLHSFNMPLIIGSSIFNDKVEICMDKGKLMGELEVPKRFKAKLENVKKVGNQLSFSITANEGRGVFQVFYSGELKENNKYFLGIAKLKDNKVLGPFMGVNSEKPIEFKVIQ